MSEQPTSLLLEPSHPEDATLPPAQRTPAEAGTLPPRASNQTTTLPPRAAELRGHLGADWFAHRSLAGHGPAGQSILNRGQPGETQ